MELQQLKYFKTVAAIGKISEAAEALFISAPALSTSISRLEKELGVQLFDRYAKRIALNAQGEIFLRYVNQDGISYMVSVGEEIIVTGKLYKFTDSSTLGITIDFVQPAQ